MIKAALRECGSIGETETPSSEQFSDCSFALNLIIKAWVKKGMPLWKVVEVVVPMIANQITYQIGPTATGTGAIVTDRPLRVLDSFIRSPQNNDVSLMHLARSDYEALGNKTPGSSIPNSIYYQSLSINGLLTVYPSPQASDYSIHLFVQSPINDVNSGTDVMDFPSECYQALKWNLADEIGGETGASDSKLLRIEKRARLYKDEMESWSVETASLYMTRDTRRS
ncbi:MAG: hypothetical protein ACREQ5_11475 [Candidatus Dormibacteria bacterium]